LSDDHKLIDIISVNEIDLEMTMEGSPWVHYCSSSGHAEHFTQRHHYDKIQ